MKKSAIHFRVTVELRDKFNKKCESNLSSSSKVLRALMKEYIKRGNDVFK